MSKFNVGDEVTVIETILDSDLPVGSVAIISGMIPHHIFGMDDAEVFLEGQGENWYSVDQLKLSAPKEVVNSPLYKALK